MINVWKSEVRKLSRPRLAISNFIIAFTLQAAVTVTIFLKSKNSLVTDLSKSSGLFYGTKIIAPFLGVISFCLFAANFAQEYSNGTLKNLLVRHPNRITLIIGKITALFTFNFLLIILTSFLNVLLSYLLSNNGAIDTSTWEVLSLSFLAPLFNLLLAASVYGILGGFLAIVFRSSVMAISAGLIWFFVLETLMGFLSKSITRLMPGGNLANFADGGSSEMSFTHSASVVGAYAAVSAVVLLIIFDKRDVAN